MAWIAGVGRVPQALADGQARRPGLHHRQSQCTQLSYWELHCAARPWERRTEYKRHTGLREVGMQFDGC